MIFAGTCRGEAWVRIVCRIPVTDGIVKRMTVEQFDEQNYPHVVFPLLPHHQGVFDFRQGLHLAIDLRRADANPTRIEGGVGAPINHHTAPVVDLNVIPVAPDAGINIKISRVILFAVRVIPEINGHGRGGGGADQLPLLADHRLAIAVVCLDLHSQSAALQFAGIDRADGVAQGKTAIDVGTPGDGCQLQVFFDISVNEIKPLDGKGRAG